MPKKRNHKKAESKAERHARIQNKENVIRRSGNCVDFSEDMIQKVMEKYNIKDYRLDPWGDLRIQSKFDLWIIRADEEVVVLWHGSDRKLRIGNDRSSYHMQNVFYDLDFAVQSIIEHDEYKLASSTEQKKEYKFSGETY